MVVTTPGAETQPDNVPEADWVEQEADVDPLSEEDDEPETQSPNLGRGTTEANEADVAEQLAPLAGEDDGDAELRPDLSSADANEADVAEQGLIVAGDDEDAYPAEEGQ